jgi:uncharacterized protein YbjT (DUF2867 family)
MSAYVVAGATGRVGSVVAREVLARGKTTRVIVRDGASATRWRGLGADAITGSLDDRSFLTTALRDAEGFFVLLPENVPPPAFHAPRQRMADAIATAVQDAGVPRLVLLSAIAAAIPDGNGPAKALHHLEHRLGETGTPLTRIRPCYYQDNIAGMLAPATSQGVFPSFLPADVAVPMVATRDVGRVAAEALADGPPVTEIVDVLGPAYSARQLAAALGTALRRLVNIVEVPPHAHVRTLTSTGMPLEMAEAVAEMMGAFAAGRIAPCGHRTVVGTTPIDDVIAGILKR